MTVTSPAGPGAGACYADPMESAGVGDPGLSFATRAGMRLRHSGRLGRDVLRFGAQQRLWWLVPMILVLMLLALAITTTTTAVPVAVYTLF